MTGTPNLDNVNVTMEVKYTNGGRSRNNCWLDILIGAAKTSTTQEIDFSTEACANLRDEFGFLSCENLQMHVVAERQILPESDVVFLDDCMFVVHIMCANCKLIT